MAFTEELIGALHLKGYRILVTTYLVDLFLFQLTVPRWNKPGRPRLPYVLFDASGDDRAVQLWPVDGIAYWPPFRDIDSSALESFRERFRRIPRRP